MGVRYSDDPVGVGFTLLLLLILASPALIKTLRMLFRINPKRRYRRK